MLKNKLTILRIVIATVVGLLLFCYLLLLLPWVQNKLITRVASSLSKSIGTEVKIGHVGFSLFNRLDLEDILIKDEKNDTLVFSKIGKLRLTDLYFSNSAPVIRYIGLEGTRIYLNRSTPKWNYQFLLDYLNKDSSNQKSTSLDIKKIDLSDFRFILDDQWDGEKTELAAKNLLLNIKLFNQANKQIVIDQLIVNKPFINLHSYEGKNTTVQKDTNQGNFKPAQLNPNDLSIVANEIQVINGKFLIEYGFEKPVPYFDGAHIRMHDLNAQIYNATLSKDTLTAKVNLSVKERSGFEIKKLSTHFKLTSQIMEFAQLSLKTNNSIIGPYYAMQYKSFKNDFNNYMQNVTMKAHFENSLVAIKDIAYFTPALNNIDQKVKLNFHFNGTVADFETKDLLVNYNNSTIKGSFSMKGLPSLRNTQIDFNNVISATNFKDLSNWLPAIKNNKEIKFEKLGNILFAGNFKGTVYDFITKGEFNTDLGYTNTEIRLQFPLDKEPSYEGILKTSHFNAGKLFDISSLGLLNFNGKIKGSSFDLNKQKTNIQGNIDSIAWNNYNYTNITTNGDIQKGAYNGSLKIKDPNINFISNIEVDFNQAKPKINAVGDLQNTNLKELGFSKNKIQLTGLLDINFDGDSIDNFMGYAKFYNGQLKGEQSVVRFDSITLNSSIEKGIKYLRLASDDINANISGKFNISHLPASIQFFMQRYLPSYIPAPSNTPANQLFDIQIKTNYIEPFIRIFNSSFSGFNNLNLKGAINTDSKTLKFNATVPFAQWQDMAFKGGVFTGNGNKDSIHLLVKANNYQITDSFSFVDPIINIHTANDKSNIQITATSNNALQNINLAGTVNTYSDGLAIKWKPSYFLLNQKRWDINNGGEISLRKNNIFAKGVKFSQGLQELLLTSAKDNNLQLELNDIILGDITKLFFRYPQLEGITNGTVNLKNVLDNFELSSDINIDQFSFNNEVVGMTNLNASYNNKTGIVPFSFDIPNKAYNLSAEGSYNTKDSANPLDATLYLNHSKFSLVEQFIGGVLTNLEGKADGKIHFGGRIEYPVLLGAATIQDASLKVDYTKVRYFIKEATIQFTNEGMDFGNIQLTDQLNRKALFKGKILNEGFKHLTYDLEMSSPKIELLNMGSADNIYFYGNAVGKAAMTIKGPEENIKMTINADVNDSSHLYIPNTTSKEAGSNDFILFKKYGKTAVKSADVPTYNLLVDLDLSANNKTKIDVILDELTGDIIKAKGNGRLKIRAGNIEPLSIRGKYNIESGNYDFNFQSFIKKPFELIPEIGNYIEWTGNPYDAEIHVDARYTADRISLNELVGSANFSNAVKSYRGSVYVIAALRNKLFQPNIKFSIAFPQGNPISSDNEFSQFITRLERDENEILKQVSFLIVFNSFAPVGFSTGNSNNAYSMTSIGINTISQLLTKEVNKSVTHLLNKVTGDNSLRFDIGSSVYNSGNLLDPTGSGIPINANKIDRQRVNLKLGRSFLNDKVIINVGGDLDFNVRSSTNIQNDNLQWLPDLNIEFILTRDRKLRAIVFNRNSLDINGSSLGRRNRQGVSISYRKDFEKFLF